MFRPQLLDAVCWEIFVKCGASDFELVDDVADEWVVFGVFEHSLGVFDVLLVHGFWPTPTPSAFCGSFKTGAGVFNNQLALELVKCSCHMEKQPSLWGAGVDVLGQNFEGDTAFCDVGGCLDHLRERPRQSRELPDSQRVSFAQIIEGSLELRTVAMGTGSFFDKDPLAADIA